MKEKDSVKTLRGMTKGSVWDLQESDVFMLWAKPDKDDAITERAQHYLDVLRTAFEMEEVVVDNPEVIKKLEARGLCIGIIPIKDKDQKWAIRKRPILRVTDLTYENIHHISAVKLLEVIDRNFGGGWDSLNQGIKDIIQNGFDISTTTLPKDRLHKPGGLYDIKINDGFEVLEIEKGGWIEAIFAKVKPVLAKPTARMDHNSDSFDESEDDLPDDSYYQDDDDDELDDDTLTEESYRTTIEEDPDALSLDAAEISDDGDDY